MMQHYFRKLQIVVILECLVLIAFTASNVFASPVSVYPDHAEAFSQSLNGKWNFKYISGLNASAHESFIEPRFDVFEWDSIVVPSNWEIEGFAEPRYDKDLEDGLGLYRRNFTLPSNWDDRRIFIRFDGVAFGFTVWVDGIEIGQSTTSAFNQHTFDITDAVRTSDGDEHLLAIRVTTKPFGWQFDINDDWSLSGIYRNVTLFSLPEMHIRDYTATTKIATDGSSELTLSVETSQPEARVRAQLMAPDGGKVFEIELPDRSNGYHAATVRIENPELWTAETPSLYQLDLELMADDGTQQLVREKIGLREVTIEGNVFLLNGRPIKLRGVNRHDETPETGRALSESQMRRDLEIMREANMNFVRTAHYPSTPRFIELCDELGFYVMCEVALGKGNEQMGDPAYLENILARARATVMRDKNRPSVLIWSIGNENPISDAEMEAGQLVKELDPTRPICIPKNPYVFADDWEKIPDFVDIYAPHYPRIEDMRKYAEILKRPTIFTEYAHALGLASSRAQEGWALMQETPHFTGGSIWHLTDQGILKYSRNPVDRNKSTRNVWLDEHYFYDTNGTQGADGLVYSDRTPQTDFWLVRKVYSPVQIKESSVSVEPGMNHIELTIENHHDFRSLKGMQLVWGFELNGKHIQGGNLQLHALSGEQQKVIIPLNIQTNMDKDILVLTLKCINESGYEIIDRTVELKMSGADRTDWIEQLPITSPLSLSESVDEVTIKHLAHVISINRRSGELTIRDGAGLALVSGIYPHTGRMLTMSESYRSREGLMWRIPMLTDNKDPKISVQEEDDSVRIAVSGRYPREEGSDQAIVGEYVATINANGLFRINYDYALENTKGTFSEAGLTVLVPENLSEFRWIGDGPYAGYPGKDALSDFGIYHLNCEDLYFRGNRRKTEIAMLTTPEGSGIAMILNPGEVSVENSQDGIRFSHNCVIGSLGDKIWPPEYLPDASKLQNLSGNFTLFLLDENWPIQLKRYFGVPGGPVDVYRPFYHSYDQ